jgi:hypothetical protein
MKNSTGTPPRKHGVRYPWDEWFDKGSMTLVRGTHFTGAPHGMARTAQQAAARAGLTISVRVDADKLTIRVVRQ